LIPSVVNEFEKLEAGDPYYFDRWDNDRDGVPCLYYWFRSRDGSGRNVKRVPAHEILRVLRQIHARGSLIRSAFKSLCPVPDNAGPCGFAVVGRIVEALGVARYSGRKQGFTITNQARARDLLGF
jgi:hypothetical protein